jgi:hypothetical protein
VVYDHIVIGEQHEIELGTSNPCVARSSRTAILDMTQDRDAWVSQEGSQRGFDRNGGAVIDQNDLDLAGQ